MPIYEYVCLDCDETFAKLRPMSKAADPVACARCGSSHTTRAISLFAAVSHGSHGETRTIAGTGRGCGTCATRACSTCSH